jgi:16S rRNA C967 or C1407 C5-methylase (RsmB/RsmF family)
MTRSGNRGQEAFHRYYGDLFADRWQALAAALKQDPAYYELRKGLIEPYYLDSASVAAAEALPLSEGDSLLDMCAAPGGKALVIAGSLSESMHLTVNEYSRSRRSRLQQVLCAHLPSQTLSRITLTNYDASQWCLYEKAAYDKILLDVPCSSERHLLREPKHLDRWSPARIRNLSARAYTLLASALQTVKTGGMVLYCTCALNPDENDGVIKRLIDKGRHPARILDTGLLQGEETCYGRHILPDTSSGSGPIYACLLQRI